MTIDVLQISNADSNEGDSYCNVEAGDSGYGNYTNAEPLENKVTDNNNTCTNQVS